LYRDEGEDADVEDEGKDESDRLLHQEFSRSDAGRLSYRDDDKSDRLLHQEFRLLRSPCRHKPLEYPSDLAVDVSICVRERISRRAAAVHDVILDTGSALIVMIFGRNSSSVVMVLYLGTNVNARMVSAQK